MDDFTSFYGSLTSTTSGSPAKPKPKSPTSPSAPPQVQPANTAVHIALCPPSDTESTSPTSNPSSCDSDSSASSSEPASPSSPPARGSPAAPSASRASLLSPMAAAVAASTFAKPLSPASASAKLAPTPRAPSSTRTTTRNPALPPRSQDRSLLSPVFPTVSSAQRVSSATAPGSGRNKVALEPGHSPLDWAQYKNSGKDLTGIPAGHPRVRLTLDEVAKHKAVDDCWTVLNGKVYNMTAYVKYHPGGVKQLMKGAGKDSTKLFLAVHAWVNAEYMLDACYLGLLES